MKVPKARIELACSKDAMRYALNSVFLDKEANRLVASDGHIMAVVPADGCEGDTGGLVPIAAIKEARKASKTPQVILNGDARLADGRSFPRGEGDFPDYRKLLLDEKEEYFHEVKINAKLLLRLAESISEVSSDKGFYVTLKFRKGKNLSFRVEGNGGFGVMMPISS